MIVRRETPLALYKGLGAVLSGIVPKMAIRFASFEKYKAWLADKETGATAVGSIFLGACSLFPIGSGSLDADQVLHFHIASAAISCPYASDSLRVHAHSQPALARASRRRSSS